jgi:hypothetical protein
MKRGYILIEALITYMAMSFFLITICAITSILMNLPQITYLSQLDVFKLQFEQLTMRSKNFSIENDQLCFDLDIRRFCVKSDRNRLIKIPGYEILLDEVFDIQLEFDGNEITINGYYDKKRFVLHFKIK